MPSPAVHRLRLAAHYAAGIPALRASDVLLCSFPRSGSTLARFVLAHYAALADGRGATPLGFPEMKAAMPELGASGLWRARATGGLPRVVKTHRPFAAVLARPRAVLLVRDPLDAVSSYHTYWTQRSAGPAVSLAAFLRDGRRGLPRWVAHTRSWLPRAVHVVRYEALREDPAGEVGRMLAALGVRADGERLREAASRSAAGRVRAASHAAHVTGLDRFGAGFALVRDRPPGAGTAEFSGADRAWAAARLAEAGLGAWADGGDA